MVKKSAVISVPTIICNILSKFRTRIGFFFLIYIPVSVARAKVASMVRLAAFILTLINSFAETISETWVQKCNGCANLAR